MVGSTPHSRCDSVVITSSRYRSLQHVWRMFAAQSVTISLALSTLVSLLLANNLGDGVLTCMTAYHTRSGYHC